MEKIVIDSEKFDVATLNNKDEIQVKFENLTLENIITLMGSIFCAEEKGELNTKVYFNLKGTSTENLVEIYRSFFKRESLTNDCMLINIKILIDGYNTLDDSLFQMEEIFVSDLEQILDVKLALSKDIKELQKQLVTWFLASLKSMCKLELTYLDNCVEMPTMYKKMILASSLLGISQIFNKVDSIDTAKLPLVLDAYPIIETVASASSISKKLLESLNS